MDGKRGMDGEPIRPWYRAGMPGTCPTGMPGCCSADALGGGQKGIDGGAFSQLSGVTGFGSNAGGSNGGNACNGALA